MKFRIILLLTLISFSASAQRLSDLVVKSSITGTEKIPVSGSGTPGPAITPNMLSTFGGDFTNVVQHLGLSNTGVSDVGAGINAAIAGGKRKFYFPAGTYLVTTAITLVDNVIIIGAGRSVSIIKLTSNITAITTGRYNTIRSIGFLGTYGSGGNTSQRAIVMTSVLGTEVVDCYSNYIAGYFATIQTLPISPPVNGPYFGNKVIGCFGDTNQGGVFCDVRGEYNVISNNTFVDGNYGIRIAGGNNLVSNNNLTINAYGLYYEGGTNNAHGMCIGNTVNHCGTANLYVTAITLGQQFIGNNFYAGNIQILNSTGVTIDGGDIEAGAVNSKAITITTCTATRFINNKFTITPTFTVTGTDPTVISPHFVDGGFSIYDASANARVDIINNNGSMNINTASPSTQDIVFNSLMVGKTATSFDRTRDLSIGSMRVDGGATTNDMAQFYKTSSTGATLSILDNTVNYVFAAMPTGRLALGFGATANPTAKVHLGAGTAAANSASFKMTSGTDLSTPEAGAWYYNGTRLGFSPSTVIKRFPLTNDVSPSNGQIPIGNGTDYTTANITSTGGSITVTNGSGTIDISTTKTITDGTYTPTPVNTTNVSASTAYVTGYYRVGNMVTVFGKIDIDATLAASTATELQIDLPVASNMTGEQDLAGNAISDAVASLTARVKGDATTDRASFVFKALSLNNDSYSFEFSYQVK
jgi:hypothetical protein